MLFQPKRSHNILLVPYDHTNVIICQFLGPVELPGDLKLQDKLQTTSGSVTNLHGVRNLPFTS